MRFFLSGFLIIFLLALNIICWQEIFEQFNNDLTKIEFLNVGQGDAIFIITPQQHQILIDGGPDNSVLRKIEKRMPFWDKTIDLIILTHPEKDHIRGLLGVLERYKADYILWTGVKKESAEYEKWTYLLEEQKRNGTKVVLADKDKRIKAGFLLFQIFSPSLQEIKEGTRDINDSSLVFRLVYGKNRILFTGDISARVEKKLLEEGLNLRSEVLKVAHHGSKYSSSLDFLKQVLPEIGVICVGKNSYGHPSYEVIERLKEVGVRILRTDKNGDILILSDSQRLIVKTEK